MTTNLGAASPCSSVVLSLTPASAIARFAKSSIVTEQSSKVT